MYGIYTQTVHFGQLDGFVRDEHLASGGWESPEEYAESNMSSSIMFDWKVFFEDNAPNLLFYLYDII